MQLNTLLIFRVFNFHLVTRYLLCRWLRRSVTTLATSIAEYEMFEIQITKTYGRFEWSKDLKTIMWMSERDNKPTFSVFRHADQEAFWGTSTHFKHR